jgi:hypothetical protein
MKTIVRNVFFPRAAATLLTMLLTMTAQTAWADNFVVTANSVSWTCTVIDETTKTVKIKPTYRNAISGKVTIPETVKNSGVDYTVTEIESYAFDRCTGLTSVSIPASVTKIGSGAFWYCSNLATYSGGSGVTVIERFAFEGCSSLTSFTIPSGVTVIEANTFKQSGLTSITIPANVTRICLDAFSGCSGLTSVTIPASVTYIDDNPFWGCGKLSVITVDEGNPNYKAVDGVLFSKDDKTLIAYPNGKEGTTYTIPASVTEIRDYAFSGCSGLTSVTIPVGVTEIRDYAFSGCSGLTSVTIPAGVTKISSNAFNGCSGLTSVTIPASVTEIGDYAFLNCSGLTSVTIPVGVTEIGINAFFGCSGLTSVTIYAKYLNLYNSDVFESTHADLKIYVFRDCVETYKRGWKDYADADAIQEIPETQLALSGVPVNQNPGKADEYWCTYYPSLANVKINTSGVEIYTAILNGANDKVTLVEVGGSVIMVGQAVMLKASSSTPISMKLTSADADGAYSYNDLKGGAGVPAGYDAYTLSAANGKMGFYKFDGTAATLDPNKAHLEIPTPTSGSRGFIGIGDDETTGLIPSLSTKGEGSGFWYSLDGRRLSAQPTQKGVYVRNGQKIIIK